MAEKIISANKAKQGRGGKQTVVILVVALLLAAVAWFGVEMYGESIDAPSAQQQTKPTG